MKLSYKIAIIFCAIFLLSVASSLFALREMNKLAINIDTELLITIPSREVLVALQERIDNTINSKRQLLAPHLSFPERWTHLQQYKKQFGDVLAARHKLDGLLAVADLPETTLLWNKLQPLFNEWETADSQIERLLQRWFSTGIANPDSLGNLLRQFEDEHAAALDAVEKVLLRRTTPADAQTAMEPVCAMEEWWTRFDESHRLYAEGTWDGLRPHRLSDGSLTEELSKNNVIAAALEQMRESHARFHRLLNDIQSALDAGNRSAVITFLNECVTAMETMRMHFRAMHEEGQRVAALMSEAQGMELTLRTYQSHIQRIMEAIVAANAEELSSQSDLAVKSVQRTMRNMQLLLGTFVLLSLGLGAYSLNAYKKNQRERQLLQCEREAAFVQMHFLFNTFPMGCLVRDSEYHLRNCNQAAAQLFGIEEQWEEMEKNAIAFGLANKWEYLERYAELIDPEFQPNGEPSREKTRQLFHTAFDTGCVKTKWMYQAADGTPLPAEVTLLRTDWEGRPAIVYHIRDLREETALHAAEEAARERMRIMFDAAPFSCHIRDSQGGIRDCNVQTLRIYGLKNKEEFEKLFPSLSPETQPNGESSRERSTMLINAAFETGYQNFRWQHLKTDGTPFTAEVTLIRVMWENSPALACYMRILHENRRNAVRHTITQPCSVLWHLPDGSSGSAQIVDISSTGLGLQGDITKLQAHQTVKLSCETPPLDTVLHGLSGRLCWIFDGGVGVELDTPLTANVEMLACCLNETRENE